MPDLAARPLSAQALSELRDRKPGLLFALAEQLVPPALAAIDPAACLGIDLSSFRTLEDVRQVLSAVLKAIAQGEITPAEGVHIAKRVDARLRAGQRLERLERRSALQSCPVWTPPDRMASSAPIRQRRDKARGFA